MAKAIFIFGGRTTLIKAYMSNLPVYYMLLFRMKNVMSERLDRIRRNLLWEGQSDKKKLHLMKWGRGH